MDVQRRQGAIRYALYAHRLGLGEPAPCLERLRAGKAEISGDQELGVASALGGGQDRRERVGVAMDVRDAKETHTAEHRSREAHAQGEGC